MVLLPEVLAQWKDLARGVAPRACLPEAESGLLRWIEYHTGRALRSAPFSLL